MTLNFAKGSKHTAPTFLKSFVVSISFCHFVLGLTGADMCRESLRVQGVARESYLTKRKRCQRDPLTVQQVRTLDLLVCGELDARPTEQLGAWFFLVCLYSRARYSNGFNMCDIFIDCPGPKRIPLYGFFQGRVSRSKTAYTTERKTMNLSMVGRRSGVSGRDWVGAGLALRKRLPIPMSEGNPLLPAPTRAGWQQVPLGAGQAGLWLRGILKMLGESHDAVSNVGTRSCKTTVLSWLAKAGVALETRRILGMHIRPGEQTPLVYSRDALSGPLREMQAVIDEVASGAFRPDETRSGYRAADGDVLAESGEAADGDPLYAPSSEDSADEEDDAEDRHLVDEAVNAVVHPWRHIEIGADDGRAADDAPLFRHKQSGVFHLAKDEGGDRTKCGHGLNTNYEQLGAKPLFMYPMCPRCFR